MSSKDTPLDVDRQSLKTEEAAGRHESDSSWFGRIREVSRYQWLVLIVAWLGWVFDAMDGALFSLVQTPSMTDLIGHAAPGSLIGFYAGVVSAGMLRRSPRWWRSSPVRSPRTLPGRILPSMAE